jgi:hypothetical protein
MHIYIPIPVEWTLAHTALLFMYLLGAIFVWFAASFLDAMGAAMSRGKLAPTPWKNVFIAAFWPVTIPVMALIGLAFSIFK